MTKELALQYFESKMKEKTFCLILNLVLALIIFANAKAGSLLGIKVLPLAISVVWPATGFSFAALLLFGYKAWPGIFLGNFIYNFTNLYFDNPDLIGSLLTTCIISSGSLLEALVGAYVMKRYTSVGYFNTVKDIFIFLIPATILTNVIGSTIGVTSLYIYGKLPIDILIYTWLTFWIGDTMGVYTITPLIIVWSIHKAPVAFKQYMGEAFLMFLSFLLVSYFAFYQNYPVSNFFIPITAWVSYRYRKHGATLAAFIISFVTIIASTHGHGTFMTNISHYSLMNLVIFLEITIAVSLVVANMTNERDRAISALQNHAADLKQSVDIHLEEIREMSSEVLVKEKLTSLGLITTSMAKEIQTPLKIIKNFTYASLDCINRINESLDTINQSPEVLSNFETLKNYINNIIKFGDHTRLIAQIIQEESSIITSKGTRFTTTDLNSLVNLCLIHATTDEARLHPEFVFAISKDLDKKVKMVLSFPDDLAQALKHILKYAIYSMREKMALLGESYKPFLEIHTEDRDSEVSVIIRNNGMGVSEKNLKVLFQSFVRNELPKAATQFFEETTSLGLSLAYDIVVQVYHGMVSAESKEGEYLQIKITLPQQSEIKTD